jgi:hypothetical protein
VQRNSLTVHLKSHHKGLPSVYVSRWPRGRRKRGRSSSPGLENREPEPETESGRTISKEEPGQQGGGENGDEQGTGEEDMVSDPDPYPEVKNCHVFKYWVFSFEG